MTTVLTVLLFLVGLSASCVCEFTFHQLVKGHRINYVRKLHPFTITDISFKISSQIPYKKYGWEVERNHEEDHGNIINLQKTNPLRICRQAGIFEAPSQN